jgi:hypothetical protein
MMWVTPEKSWCFEMLEKAINGGPSIASFNDRVNTFWSTAKLDKHRKPRPDELPADVKTFLWKSCPRVQRPFGIGSDRQMGRSSIRNNKHLLNRQRNIRFPKGITWNLNPSVFGFRSN